MKAQHIAVFNTEHLSSMFERVIIASGTSNRQTKALAASVRDSVKGRGMQVLSTEGEDNGEWIIVDCGAAVAHIMQPAIREYYHLEEIWGGKSVKMKIDTAPLKLVKPEVETEAAPKKVAAKKAPDAAKSAAKTAAGKAPARKPAAKKAAAKRAAAKRAPAARRPVATKAAAKKTPARPRAR